MNFILKFRHFKFIRLLSTWITCSLFSPLQAKIQVVFSIFFLLLSPSPLPPSLPYLSLNFFVSVWKKRSQVKQERGLNPFFSAKNLSCRICLDCGECFPQTTSDFISSCLILMHCNCFWEEALHVSILLNKEYVVDFFSLMEWNIYYFIMIAFFVTCW